MRNVKHEYQGAEGLRAISALTGIPHPTLCQRIQKLGMTVEEAVNHQKGAFVKKKQHEYQGITGLAEIARHYGMSITTLFCRVEYQGMTIEEALNKPLRKARSRQAKKAAKPRPNQQENVQGKAVAERAALWKLALGITA